MWEERALTIACVLFEADKEEREREKENRNQWNANQRLGEDANASGNERFVIARTERKQRPI
jgi:hypothetical protein